MASENIIVVVVVTGLLFFLSICRQPLLLVL